MRLASLIGWICLASVAAGFQVQTWPLLSKASRRSALPVTLTANACLGKLMAFPVDSPILVQTWTLPFWPTAMRWSAAMAMLAYVVESETSKAGVSSLLFQV